MTRKTFNRIMEGALVVLVAGSPLAFGGVSPWGYKSICAVVFVMAAVLAARSLSKGTFSYVVTPANYLLPLAAIFGIVQIIPLPVLLVESVSPGMANMRAAAGETGAFDTFALYPWESANNSVLMVAVILLYLLVINVVRSRKQVARIRAVVIATGAMIALGMLAQKAYGLKHPTLPFVNKNHFAGYMEMVMPLAAAALAFRRHNFSTGERGLSTRIREMASGLMSGKPALLMMAVLVMLTALIQSMSRGGVIGAAFSLVVLAAFILRYRNPLAVVLLAGVVTLTAMMSVMANEGVVERVKTFSEFTEDSSTMTRLTVWSDTARIVRDFPVTGVGLGGFESVYPSYKSFMKHYNVNQPESDYLYTLAEAGAAGLLLAIAFAVISLKGVAGGLARRPGRFASGVAAGAIAGFAALAMHGFVDTALHMPSIPVTLAVVLGVAYSAVHGGKGRTGRKARVRLSERPVLRWTLVAAMVALPLIAVKVEAGAVADMCYRVGMFGAGKLPETGEVRQARLRNLVNIYNTAATIEPGSAEYSLELGRTYYFIAGPLENEGNGSGAAELYRKSYAAAANAVANDPYNSYAQVMLGTVIEEGLKDPAAAEASFVSSDRLNPTNPDIKNYIAGYYSRQGQAYKARQYRKQVPFLDPSLNEVKVWPDRSNYRAVSGDVVTWTAKTRYRVKGMEYKFRLWRQGEGFVDERPFSKVNTWTWDTTGIKSGRYNVVVWIRSEQSKIKGANFHAPNTFILEDPR